MSLAQGETGFHAPSLQEFTPPAVLFEGTFFELNRIRLIALFVTLLVSMFFVIAFRRPQLVPRGVQNMGEVAIDFVRFHIVDEIIGAEGRRFLPYLVTLFFLILSLNVTGIMPPFNIPPTSVVALPLILAACTWLVFNYTGIKEQGLGSYLKHTLFPPGVPLPIYLLVTPIEFVSTFVLRPATLTIRLLANMMAGHLMLVLFFSGASYLLLEADVWIKAFGVISAAMGFAFTLFELLVAFLQAYIFTLLTAVYLAGALNPHHH